ncbi:hypothetical protein [Geitlerinema calcuttense]|uniref:Uncharacterized protein n=1 Tax=Geitlerinema calcuttense NRMC-F 0142 TaxID=2922238 RepID=A0ABT7LYL5_9CYAN|nr:hypothetical protein [Geitlerinema calcuttense]MDL5056894.1 hypothetical protein [Geitlerinema calcuttense NRMC-F 0142]
MSKIEENLGMKAIIRIIIIIFLIFSYNYNTCKLSAVTAGQKKSRELYFEYASTLYANSLLSNLKAVVLVSPDLNRNNDMIIPKSQSQNIYLKIPNQIKPFKVKKVLWNSQEIDNDIFIVSGMRF